MTLDFPLVSLFPQPLGPSEGELSGTDTKLSETGTTTQSAGLDHTTKPPGGQVSTKPPAVTREGLGVRGVESKHLISKREKLRLGGGVGEQKPKFGISGLLGGATAPAPLLPLLFFPKMPGMTGSNLYLGVLRCYEQEGGRGK